MSINFNNFYVSVCDSLEYEIEYFKDQLTSAECSKQLVICFGMTAF
jgi:hypothetical protein